MKGEMIDVEFSRWSYIIESRNWMKRYVLGFQLFFTFLPFYFLFHRAFSQTLLRPTRAEGQFVRMQPTRFHFCVYMRAGHYIVHMMLPPYLPYLWFWLWFGIMDNMYINFLRKDILNVFPLFPLILVCPTCF